MKHTVLQKILDNFDILTHSINVLVARHLHNNSKKKVARVVQDAFPNVTVLQAPEGQLLGS